MFQIYQNGRLFGTYCGNSVPEVMILNEMPVVVEFESDSIETGPGYKISYRASTLPGRGEYILLHFEAPVKKY